MIDFVNSLSGQEDRLAKVFGVKEVVINPKESLDSFDFIDFLAMTDSSVEVNANEHAATQKIIQALAVFCMTWMQQAALPSVTLTDDLLESLPENLGLRTGFTEDDHWIFELIDTTTGESYSYIQLLLGVIDELEKESEGE